MAFAKVLFALNYICSDDIVSKWHHPDVVKRNVASVNVLSTLLVRANVLEQMRSGEKSCEPGHNVIKILQP